MKINKISGFISAPFTPMNSDGSVNLSLIGAYSDYYVRNGIDGAFICGSSGEGYLLTNEERKDIAMQWIKASPADFKNIIHVGTPVLEYSKELARHAGECGAWGIGSMAPVFFKPNRVEELVQYCSEIASAAPDLPFYFYHIPGMTGVFHSMVEFLEKAYERIPNMAGIKFTHENLYEFDQCRKVKDGHFDILHGQDETLLAGLALGATGGVGGTFNHAMGIYISIKDSFDQGDFERARGYQARSQALIDIIIRFRGNIVSGKRIMKFLGLDCGPNRSPIQNITAEEETQLRDELEKIGFFNFCNK